MRILMIAPRPGIQGPIPKHTPVLAEALRGLGCQVDVEGWGRSTDRESWPTKLVSRFRDIARVRRAVRLTRYDVVVLKTSHEWTTLLRDVPLALATRKSVTRLVVQFHGSLPDRLNAPGHRMFKRASRLLLGLADAVFVLSSEERDGFSRFCPDGSFVVVSNPSTTPPRTAVVRQEPRRSGADQELALLYVGRLIREKGVFDLLDAVALLGEQSQWHLAVAGDGADRRAISSRIEELGLTHEVRLAGYLDGSLLDEAYRDADLLVLPTYWGEGFPTVITEAMAAGLPVVTTAVRGIADHLEDGLNAVFVPPRDPCALAGVLRRLMSDRGLLLRMSEANLRKVADFAPERVARHYLAALEDVVREARPPIDHALSSSSR